MQKKLISLLFFTLVIFFIYTTMQDTDEGMTAGEIGEIQEKEQVQQVQQVQQSPNLTQEHRNVALIANEGSDDSLDEMAAYYSPMDDGSLVPDMEPSNDALYSNYEEKPELNQNFLQTQYSIGIDTSQVPRNFIKDIRGYPQNIVSLEVLSPFNQPTIVPDTMRRSIADVS